MPILGVAGKIRSVTVKNRILIGNWFHCDRHLSTCTLPILHTVAITSQNSESLYTMFATAYHSLQNYTGLWKCYTNFTSVTKISQDFLQVLLFKSKTL